MEEKVVFTSVVFPERQKHFSGEKIKDTGMYRVDLMGDVTCNSEGDEKRPF